MPDLLSNYISQNYPLWLQRAKKVRRKGTEAQELLHHTLEYVLQQPQDKIQGMIDRGEFKTYIDGALYTAAKLDSPFNRQNIIERNSIQVNESMAVDKTFLGARLDNELLDVRIDRLKPKHAALFREYVLPGFSFARYSRENNIPRTHLYRMIAHIKEEMRGLVSRVLPDIEFTDGTLKMLADREDKVLYIGGRGSAKKICEMMGRVEVVLTTKHKVKDYNQWSVINCKDSDPIFKHRSKTKKGEL